jgi:hypothetical protein
VGKRLCVWGPPVTSRVASARRAGLWEAGVVVVGSILVSRTVGRSRRWSSRVDEAEAVGAESARVRAGSIKRRAAETTEGRWDEWLEQREVAYRIASCSG